MFDFSENTHPLTRDGKSQADRQNLRALSPDFAQPDARDEKKLLAYLYEFAKAVIFVEEDKTQDNWQEFFRTGSSVQFALIAQFDAETWQRDFKDAQMRFADGLEAGNFYPLIDFIFETALTIDRWHQALSSDTEFIDGQLVINENPLRLTIQNLIQSNLQTALKQLIGTANSVSDFNIAPLSIAYQIAQNETEETKIAQKITNTRYVLPSFKESTKTLWEISPADFFLQDAALQEATNAPHTFKSVAIERLTDLFSTFYKAVREIVADTEKHTILEPTQMHEPHLGLIYTFLKLFSFAQTDLNQMPQRHLDFYFRQVLGLKERPFVPDEAHLVFEANKAFSAVKIGKKTLIKDGKDAQKAEIQFATTDELIATQAQVATLRTLHYDNTTTLFAAAIANSADGKGAPFLPNTDTSWAALGSTETPKARVGLLISSPVLRLEEGTRTATFTLTTKEDLSAIKEIIENEFEYFVSKKALEALTKKNIVFTVADKPSFVSKDAVKNKAALDYLVITDKTTNLSFVSDFWNNVERIPAFDIQLTGKKGWFKPTILPTITVDAKAITITIILGIKEQAVVVADPSVLKADFGVTEPLMQLVLNHNIVNGKKSLYDTFKNATIENVLLKAVVNGTTNFIVQNQNGLLDGTKPFLPFGAQPKVNDVFYVGSDEAFRKKLTSLTLNITWKDLPTDFEAYYKHYSELPKKDSFTVKSAVLNKRIFEDFIPSTTLTLFSLSKLDKISNELLTDPSVLTQFINWQTGEGFIRLSLNKDFKHSEYAAVAAKRSKEIADLPKDDPKGVPPDRSMPNFPYTPTIASMTIGYEAADTTTRTLQAFHLLPFEETNKVEIGIGDSVLPKFDLTKEVGDKTPLKPIEGALYIGLQAAKANETLSLLFQLNEPSADSYLAAAKIEWAYLVDNQWKKLNDGEQVLSDLTEGFIRSGIVQLVLPHDISSKETTILPPQYVWLRAATDAHSAATCKVLGVHTQAVKAVFENHENDLLRLDTPLAAGSLAKMVDPLGEIKSVAQPYNTFGGRAPETASAFYMRSSEHLRHKGRGITLNDYENLVLSAFPDIYKVKCITHTLAERKQDVPKDKLIAPGHVTIVVIPNLATQSFIERFEPKVSRGRLDDINDFLKKRIAPFVKLNVMNAIFEKIDTTSKITFVKGKSPAFYQNQLNLDLQRYLAPWAYDPTAKIEFGGQIFKNAILGFIEQRQYIDFVEDFTVKKANDSSIASKGKPNDEGVLTTGTARGIFVSGKHDITLASV